MLILEPQGYARSKAEVTSEHEGLELLRASPKAEVSCPPFLEKQSYAG